jgi:hypothetical protein
MVCLTALLGSLLVVATPSTSYAFGWRDLDPTNRDSAIREGARDIDPTESYVKLQARHSGMCWHIRSASKAARVPVWTWECLNDEHFKFKMIPVGGDYFQLQDKNSGLCLHVRNASKGKRAPLWTWKCSNEDHFKFTKIPTSDGYFMLKAKHSGMCLHVRNASKGRRTPIWTWPCPSSRTAHFEFREVR